MMRIWLGMLVSGGLCFSGLAEDLGMVPPATNQPVALNMSMAEKGALIEAAELLRGGDLNRAETVLHRVLERSPENLEARQLWLALLVQTDRYEETRQAFEAMYKSFESDFKFLNNYAWFLATAENTSYRDPARAIDLARAALLLAPEVYNIWSTLAEAYYADGDFERSVNTMQEAINLATRFGAEAPVIENYRNELRKMAEANAVMNLME